MPALGRKCLALLLTVTLLCSLVGVAAAENGNSRPPTAPFRDTIGTRFQEAVDALHAIKVVTGKTADTYEPLSGVTRAQMAALVVRALGLSTAAPASDPFPDVPKGYWAAGQIAAAAERNIIKGGTDGYFRPEDPVTYPQAVAMLLRALNREPAGAKFPATHVLIANELGMIEGVDWGIDKAATRGDIAIMLHRSVFVIPRAGYELTLNQLVFKRVGKVTLEPASEALPKGTTQLKAAVLDWAGKSLESPVTWSVAAGGATVSNSGELQVSGESAVTVVASVGGIEAVKTYQVIQSLNVTADKQSVSTGETVKLSATGNTTAGKQIAITPAWTVIRGNGSVSTDGVLSVTGDSAVTVRGTVGSMSAETTIQVVGGITISPATIVVGPNQDVQLTAAVKDAAGRVVEVPVRWSVTGGGTVSQSGKYTAGNTPGTVVATAGHLTAQASVKIVGRIEVSPGSGVFKRSDAPLFAATVYSSENEVLNVPVAWDVQPKSIGFMTTDNRFYASNSGAGHVIASYAGVTTRVPVTVAGPATAIRLSAAPNSVPANGTSTTVITARLVDAAGNTAVGPDQIMFSANSANLGALDKTVAKVEDGVATVTLTAGTVAGTYSILATAPGSNLAGASMNLVTTIPAVSHIALEAYPSPIAADGLSQTKIIARLVDATGATMTNTTGQVITVNLTASNTAAGFLNGTVIQIGTGARSGFSYFRAGNTPGVTVVSGYSIYRVQPTTVTSQVVGAPYKLRINTEAQSAKADSTSEIVVNVEVLDANGNVRTGDNSTIVAMSATSANHSLTVPSQQAQWGVATFRIKTSVAGVYDLSVWSINQSLLRDSGQVTFVAGNPYKLSLSVEPNASIAADGRTVATLRAKVLDAHNNVVTGAANQIRFARTGSSQHVVQMPTVTSVAASRGEVVMQVTASTGVGTDYFYAEADGLAQSPTVAVSTRITGVPVKVSVQSLTEAIVGAGVPTTIRVWIQDQLNQLVTGDNGRMVTLVATNGAAVSAPTPTVNGVATFTVSNTKAGGIGLTAVADGLASDNVERILTVVAGAPDHVVLVANPEALSADGVSRTAITATVVDRFGNPSPSSVAVNLTPSTTNHLMMGATTMVTGGQTYAMAKNVPGTTIITGTAGNYPVMPLTITTYVPGTPQRVVFDPIPTMQAGTAMTNQAVLKARILDQNGNLMTSLSTGNDLTALAVQVSGSGGNNTTNLSMTNQVGLAAHNLHPNGITLGSAAVTNGIATLTITNTRAETVTLTPIIYYRGVALRGEPATLATTAGLANRLTVVASATTVPADSPTAVTVTATLTDVHGNPVASANDTFTFTTNNPAMLTAPSQTTVSTSSGTATVTFTTSVSSAGGSAVVTVMSRRLGISGTETIVTDLAPSKPNLLVRDNYGNDTYVGPGEAGARIMVTAPARIRAQKVIVYVDGVVVPTYETVDSAVAHDSIPAGGNTFIGYVPRSYLGAVGAHEVRVVVQTPLGMSPLSDAGTLTVTP